MSLQNLLRIGQLEEHTSNSAQLGKLLAAASRCISDSREVRVSLETRFEAAYRAIMQLSMAALFANGFRPPKSRPGHHMTMIQSLTHSAGLDSDRMILLDTFRIKRHALNYSGEDIDQTSVEACTDAADDLFHHINRWINENRPDLIK